MTENGHYDRIYGLLVEQSGILGAVSQDIKALRKDFETSENISAESRAKMRESVDGLADRIAHIERRVEQAEGHIMLANAFIAKRERFEQRMGGVLSTVSWMGRRAWATVAFIAGLIFAYWRDIWAWISAQF